MQMTIQEENVRDEENPMSHIVTRIVTGSVTGPVTSMVTGLVLVPLLMVLVVSTSAGIARGQERPDGPLGFGRHPQGGSGPPPGPPPVERLLGEHAERLGLDAATREQIQSITATSRTEGDEIRDRLHALHEEMRALLSHEDPDETQVMEQVERIGLLEIEARQHRLRGMLHVRALLTPEQREELVRIHAEEKQLRPERHESGDYPGPPRHRPQGRPPRPY